MKDKRRLTGLALRLLREASAFPLDMRIAARLQQEGVTEEAFCEMVRTDGFKFVSTALLIAVQNRLRDLARPSPVPEHRNQLRDLGRRL